MMLSSLVPAVALLTTSLIHARPSPQMVGMGQAEDVKLWNDFPKMEDSMLSLDVNCWLSSSIAALAYKHADRIKGMFGNPDAGADNVTLKLYDKDLKEKTITVGRDEGKWRNVKNLDFEGPTNNMEAADLREMPWWAGAIKKAVSSIGWGDQELKTKEQFDKGYGDWGLTMLTGRKYGARKPKDLKELDALFKKSQEGSGFPMLFLTKSGKRNKYDTAMDTERYYAVVGIVKQKEGQQDWVDTYNPRGGHLTSKYDKKTEGFQRWQFVIRQDLFDDIETLIYPEDDSPLSNNFDQSSNTETPKPSSQIPDVLPPVNTVPAAAPDPTETGSPQDGVPTEASGAQPTPTPQQTQPQAAPHAEPTPASPPADTPPAPPVETPAPAPDTSAIPPAPPVPGPEPAPPQ